MDKKQIVIEKLVAGGAGIGYLDGEAVFIPDAVLGDQLAVHVTHKRKGVNWGTIEEIITPGADRVEPFCPHAATCGGCQWQQMTYAAQLVQKQQLLVDALGRIGRIENPVVAETIPSPQNQRYRYRVRLQAIATPQGTKLGFYAKGSRQLIPLTHCPLLTNNINNAWQELTAVLKDNFCPDLKEVLIAEGSEGKCGLWLRGKIHSSLLERLQALSFSGIAVRMSRQTKHTGDRTVSLKVSRRTFQAGIGQFFQANLGLAPELVNQVLIRHQSGKQYDLGVELYSGMGMLGMFLASTVASLECFEASRAAARQAVVNCQANHITNLVSHAMTAEDGLAWLLKKGKKPGLVVMDPPREGVSSAAMDSLLQLLPETLIYISCDPATLARDLKKLLAQGQYRLGTVQPLDMFPHTAHVEAVVLLERIDA